MNSEIPPTLPSSKIPPLNAGRKDDEGKLRVELIPWSALDPIVRVLMHGAKHYGDENWRLVREGPNGRTRYLAACIRHVMKHARGEYLDPDSGEPHIAHAAASILFLLAE